MNPSTDIVMMSFADPWKIADYNRGKIPLQVFNHELISARYELPSINLAKEVTDRINNKEFDWDHDFVDLHPSPFGHRLYFNFIKKLLEAAFQQYRQSPRWEDSNVPATIRKIQLGKWLILLSQ